MANWKNRIIGYGVESPELLKANPKNWRKHPPHQAAALTGVLSDVGVVQNVIVNKTTGRLVDGHLRVELALKTHQNAIPVTYVELSEAEELEILATLDPVSVLATADKEKLEGVLGEVSSADEAVKKLLNDLALKSGIKIDGEIVEDEAPEPPVEPKTVRGDLYELGRHRLLCGDSTNSDDVARLMDGEMAELLFTSPPYSDMREYGGGDMSVDHIAEFIPTFFPSVRYQVVNLGIQRKEHEIFPYWDRYISIAKGCGYKFLGWNVWVKPSAGSIGQQSAFFPIVHEWVFVFGVEFKNINRTVDRRTGVKPNRFTRAVRQADGSFSTSSVGDQYGLKEMESVFFGNAELGTIRKSHPATFPIHLPAEYLKAMTNDGDIVVDPFCGSGTTLMASGQLGRCCYAMEIEPKYCDVIVSRWVKFTGGKVRRNGEEIEWAAPV